MTQGPLPVRLIASPLMSSPRVAPSATVLLLGRWPLPAGPGVELLMGSSLSQLAQGPGGSADAAVPAAVAVDVAAAAAMRATVGVEDVAAAAATMRATVVAAVAAMGVAAAAGAAARRVPAEGARVAAVVGYDHRCGAFPSICLAGLARGLHLQSRFGRCPHEQRPASGLRRSSALDLTKTSPPEQAQFPGLSNRSLLALHTDESRLGNRMSGYPIQCV